MRTLPEWKELRNILLQEGLDVDYYIERIKEFFGLSRLGTLFSDWKPNRNSLCCVLKCIKFPDAEWHIDSIFQLTNIHIYYMVGNCSSLIRLASW